MSNITLNGLLYKGQGILTGVASWIAYNAGIVSLFNRVTGSVSLPSGSNPYIMVKWTVAMPFVKDDPAVCPCPGESPYTDTLVKLSVRFDKRIPPAQRDATLQTIQDLVLTAPFEGSVSSLEQPD